MHAAGGVLHRVFPLQCQIVARDIASPWWYCTSAHHLGTAKK
jgi:hypothetical protein